METVRHVTLLQKEIEADPRRVAEDQVMVPFRWHSQGLHRVQFSNCQSLAGLFMPNIGKPVSGILRVGLA
jgi:hypothetical protein